MRETAARANSRARSAASAAGSEQARLRIAVFTDAFLPQINGVVTATINLARSLADRGHSILIIAPKYEGAREFEHPNVKVFRVPSVPAYFYPDLRLTGLFSAEVLRLLKRERIQAIHITAPSTLGVEGIFLSRLLDLPLVGTFHTFLADERYLKHLNLNPKRIQKLSYAFLRMCYDACDLVTAPSETTSAELRELGFQSPIRTISNGIDPAAFGGEKGGALAEWAGAEGELLLFIGRIAHEKNVLYLLDCFELVAARKPGVRLLVVGDGPQMDEARRRIESPALRGRVVLAGKVEHEELVRSPIFSKCRIFVTASLTENQPMTVLESQVNGLVCVAVDAKGMKDLIKDGRNGFLAEEGDEAGFAERVLRLLDDEELLLRMRGETLAEVQRHMLGSIAREWEETYGELIANRKPRGPRMRQGRSPREAAGLAARR